MLFKIP